MITICYTHFLINKLKKYNEFYHINYLNKNLYLKKL